MNRLAFVAPLAALTLWGCDVQAPNTTPDPVIVPYVDPTVPDHWTPTTPTDQGPVDLDPPQAPLEGKVARRITIDQLRQSIPALFDGITWTIGTGRNAREGFDQLSGSLGEADYIQATNENLEPTPLFAKFMDDMAGDVCAKAVARDATKPEGDRVVVASDSDVAASLRFLRLKLHGIYVPAGNTEGLEPYLELHQRLFESDGANTAWIGVCVAMLTAPEMMTY
ncbi:MAG: hypothetical protein IPG45_16800 [Deltaproteobacteria bacterium]|jgi:hypothetical protein|nr:hypothetical protein [Deltaproteobacteria bacterium]